MSEPITERVSNDVSEPTTTNSFICVEWIKHHDSNMFAEWIKKYASTNSPEWTNYHDSDICIEWTRRIREYHLAEVNHLSGEYQRPGVNQYHR